MLAEVHHSSNQDTTEYHDCKVCFKQFKTVKYLQKHMKTHTDRKKSELIELDYLIFHILFQWNVCLYFCNRTQVLNVSFATKRTNGMVI